MTGQELRRARTRLGTTQNQIATAMQYTKNSIARMERGELAISRVTEMAVKFLLMVESKKRRKR